MKTSNECEICRAWMGNARSWAGFLKRDIGFWRRFTPAEAALVWVMLCDLARLLEMAKGA